MEKDVGTTSGGMYCQKCGKKTSALLQVDKVYDKWECTSCLLSVSPDELAKVMFEVTENLDSEFDRWANTFDELKKKGKKKWIKSATTILEKFEVRRR